MSYGIVICSICKREVHQKRNTETDRLSWFHCEDTTDICSTAQTVYPSSTEEIRGAYCGMDDLEGK